MNGLKPVPRLALLLGIVIGAVIVGFAIKVVVELREQIWQSAIRSSTDIGASVSHEIERSVQGYDLALKSVIVDLKTAGVMELPTSVRDRVLFHESTKARYLGPIVVVDSHGTSYIDSAGPIPQRESYARTEFFRHHQDVDDALLYIGHPFRAADGTRRITVSRRLAMADGAFAGVVFGTIDLAYFEELFSKLDLGAASVASLALDDGTLLMRVPHRPEDVGLALAGTQPFDAMIAEHQGSLKAYSAIDGVERQYAFRHVGEFPLLLTVALSTDAIYAGWHERSLWIGFFTALLLGGCAALAWVLQRELHRRAAVEAKLFEQSERLDVTLGSIGDAVVAIDNAGQVNYMNAVAERMTGWSIDNVRGRPLHLVLDISGHGVEDDASGAGGTEVVLHGRDGSQSVIEQSIAPIRDSAGHVIGTVVVFRDVSEARAMNNRMAFLARHDTLTDLPNRMLLAECLGRAIDRARRESHQVAVLFLDLDHFKTVNDSLGHGVGDRLLVEVAKRLRACVDPGDTVSRQGGDEFVIVLAGLERVAQASQVAERVLGTFAKPFFIDGQSLSVTTSIGIAVFPEDGREAPELTKNADAAMYLAKQSGRNVARFFTHELGDLAQKRLQFEQRFDAALRNDEFVLHYQPLCRASDGLPIGAEALVRWERDGIVVPPSEFIALAEEAGKIVQLGDVILRMACRQSQAWNAGRRQPFPVSINVSAHQFRAPGFVERVVGVLTETGLDPRCLELEITESVLLHAVEHTELVLKRLKDIGVSIALDDFGTGYSSLSYLSRFPVDRLKIDRSFIQTIAADVRTQSIVRAIIALGRDLGISVIAEGVETMEQRKRLAAMGCLEFQGYLFGRPSATFEVGPEESPDATNPIEPDRTLGAWYLLG